MMTEVIDHTIATIAAILGAMVLLGAGLAAIMVSAVLALTPYMGVAAACFVVGSAVLASLAVGFFICRQAYLPSKCEKKNSEAKHGLDDVPVELARKIISDRPATGLATAFFAGYSITKDPSAAMDNLGEFLANDHHLSQSLFSSMRSHYV